MRTIDWTHRFKRDYRRESRRHRGTGFDERLAAVVQTLAADAPLEPRHRDQRSAAHGPTFVTATLDRISYSYQKPDTDTLLLVRIGSHADLGF